MWCSRRSILLILIQILTEAALANESFSLLYSSYEKTNQSCYERTILAIHGLGLDCLPRSTKYGVVWLQTCRAVVTEGCSALPVELEGTVQGEIEESGLKRSSADQ